MSSFKQALVSTLAFLLIVCLVSVLGISSFFRSGEIKEREALTGTIDYVVIGASQGLCAFVPDILDQEMGCHSYNLCGSLITYNGRKTLLEEEIDRNPIKEVVIEISYNSLQRPSYETEGDLYLVPRLGTFSERAKYFFSTINVKDYGTPYSYYFSNGIVTFLKGAAKTVGLSSGTDSDNVGRRGFFARSQDDPSLRPEDTDRLHDSEIIDRKYNEENIVVLSEIVQMCRERDIKTTFVITPVSDAMIWTYANWDEFLNDIQSICDQYGSELYDFNLLKSRYQLLDDGTAFWGESHLCEAGAYIFSEEYGRLMAERNRGADISDRFYSSYEEMKNDSPYAALSGK